MIHITVTGIDEIVSLLDRNINEIPTFTQDVLNAIADDMTNEMKNNAHVITGYMKSSIYKSAATDMDIEVGATAPYSVYENARLGEKYGSTDDFATRAFLTVKDRAWNLVVETYNRLFHG